MRCGCCSRVAVCHKAIDEPLKVGPPNRGESLVAEGRHDPLPQRLLVAAQRGGLQTPQAWGVVVRETTDPNGGICVTGERLSDRRCLIFASDMNSGLWVLRRTD